MWMAFLLIKVFLSLIKSFTAGSIGSSRIILNTFLSNKINIQKPIKDLAIKDQPNVRIKFSLIHKKELLMRFIHQHLKD